MKIGVPAGAEGTRARAAGRIARPLLSTRTLGMRGGLGKTLLLAFLLLTTFPLSLLAILTYNEIQRDTRDRTLSSLVTVVALKEAHLIDWLEAFEGQLVLVARGFEPAAGITDWRGAMDEDSSALTGLVVVDVRDGGAGVVVDELGQVPAQAGPAASLAAGQLAAKGESISGLLWVAGEDGGVLPAVCYTDEHWALLGMLDPAALGQVIARQVGQDGSDGGILTSLVAPLPAVVLGGSGGEVVVVSNDGTTRLSAGQETGEGIDWVLAGRQGTGAYQDLAGQDVFGAYTWNARLGVGLLAEKRQADALAAGEDVTALLVASTLGAVLLSAAIAAMVTRRVTQPIVELTETAAWMARGDLGRQVVVTGKDEIGVLARAFNRMAAELRVLYDSLEAKVEERTLALREANEALEKANEYTRYYVMQLAISAEVTRVAASIRDQGVMLKTVVDLIGNAFELHYVAIYLMERGGDRLAWHVGMGGVAPAARWVKAGEPTLVGRAASPPRGKVEKVVRPDGGWELAIPLCVSGDVLGVLLLESAWKEEVPDLFGSQVPSPEAKRPGWVPESDWVVYHSLADQIAIAIENARAYALERETVERLRELDRIQAEFLTNMSHALRTPLNSVIGFSRVMLKELDGPLTDTQRDDLETIHEAGRQLLGLLNDMLDLSQLEMGMLAGSPGEVNLVEMLEGVMTTTEALVRNKPIQLHSEVPDDLPVLYTDGQRLRQVILALLSNAAKFSDAGTITLRAGLVPQSCGATASSPEEERRHEARTTTVDEVAIRVTVQGTGSEQGMALIWEQSVSGREASPSEGSSGAEGTRDQPLVLGLVVSKQVVEKLGGRIGLEQGETGVELILTLPVGRQ